MRKVMDFLTVLAMLAIWLALRAVLALVGGFVAWIGTWDPWNDALSFLIVMCGVWIIILPLGPPTLRRGRRT
jgi:hypothetical protein